MPARTQIWKGAGDRMRLIAMTTDESQGKVIITTTHSDSISKSSVETGYTVDSDGAIKIKRQINITIR